MNFFVNFVIAPLINFGFFLVFAKLLHIEPIYGTWTWMDVLTPMIIVLLLILGMTLAMKKR